MQELKLQIDNEIKKQLGEENRILSEFFMDVSRDYAFYGTTLTI